MKSLSYAALAGLLMLVCFCATASSTEELHKKKASEFFNGVDSDHQDILELLKENPNSELTADELGFTLDGEFGVLNTTGNTKTSVLKLALESTHNMENWSNQYDLQVLRRSNTVDDSEVETNRLLLAGQLDYKLENPNNRLFVYGEYDDNGFVQLRDQLTAVVGWSHIVFKEKHSTFRYSIGPGYASFRQGDTGIKFEGAIVRGTANFSYKFSNDARFRQSLSTEVSDMNTRARALTSLSAKIIERLGMQLSFEMTLDENVSDEVEAFSTQTSISLVYQFF